MALHEVVVIYGTSRNTWGHAMRRYDQSTRGIKILSAELLGTLIIFHADADGYSASRSDIAYATSPPQRNTS